MTVKRSSKALASWSPTRIKNFTFSRAFVARNLGHDLFRLVTNPLACRARPVHDGNGNESQHKLTPQGLLELVALYVTIELNEPKVGRAGDTTTSLWNASNVSLLPGPCAPLQNPTSC